MTTRYYKDKTDTLKEVGITSRQLENWRKEGLFTPELESNRKYTAGDIGKLQFIKLLISPEKDGGYGIPIATAKRLLASAPYSGWGDPPRYIDLKAHRFVTHSEIFAAYMRRNEFNLGIEVLESLVLAVMLKMFLVYRQAYRRPTVYKANRDDFMEQARKTDLLARIATTRRPLSDAELRSYIDADEDPPDETEEHTLALMVDADDHRLTANELAALVAERDHVLNDQVEFLQFMTNM